MQSAAHSREASKSWQGAVSAIFLLQESSCQNQISHSHQQYSPKSLRMQPLVSLERVVLLLNAILRYNKHLHAVSSVNVTLSGSRECVLGKLDGHVERDVGCRWQTVRGFACRRWHKSSISVFVATLSTKKNRLKSKKAQDVNTTVPYCPKRAELKWKHCQQPHRVFVLHFRRDRIQTHILDLQIPNIKRCKHSSYLKRERPLRAQAAMTRLKGERGFSRQ